MQATLIFLVIGAAVLCAQAQQYYGHNYYQPKLCGKCYLNDFKGNRGPPGPKVCTYV